MTALYDALTLGAQEFRLEVPRAFSRLAGGQSIPSLVGFPYWRGSAVLAPSYHHDAEYEVDLMRLDRPGQTFLVYDARFNGPRADPGGAILGASTPEISHVASNNLSVRINGLPQGYTISKGDYVGWQNADGTYALHRAAVTVAVTSGGEIPDMAVEPPIRPGTPTGLDVSLVRPVIKAQVSESRYGSARPVITDGAGFEWHEAMR